MTPIQYTHIAFELWGCLYCIICMIVIMLTRRSEKKYTYRVIIMLGCIAACLLNDSLAWNFRGSSSEAAYYMVRITNFLSYGLNILLIYLMHECDISLVEIRSGGKVRSKGFELAEIIICSIGAIALILSRVFNFYYYIDENNVYHRGRFISFHFCVCLIGVVLILIHTIRYFSYLENVEKNTIILYAIIIFPAIIIQLFFYGFSYVNFANAIAAVMFFLSYQMQRSRDLVKKEIEAEEMKIRLYSRQIQPHFIVNSLLAISDFCEGNEKAQEALDHFSGYLRTNAQFYSEDNCIPAERELELVENYLYMEKQRFGSKIEYEIQKEDVRFRLPPFTIQTLVENAVRHGIRKNESGSGKIIIKTFIKGNNACVEVSDNGPGFDPKKVTEDCDPHVGLENVRKRLELMCKGKIIIKTQPGKGTDVTAVIPDPDLENTKEEL